MYGINVSSCMYKIPSLQQQNNNNLSILENINGQNCVYLQVAIRKWTYYFRK
jgi:hypothetical protein